MDGCPARFSSVSETGVKPSYARIIVLAVVLVVIGVLVYGTGGYVLLNKQHVTDQLRAAEFKPTAANREQVKRSGMSATGQFLFYASDPVVLDKFDFNTTCSAETVDTSILGCYIPSTKRIYLYHQTDKRVDGDEEVMAAHEMLRAAWDRMSVAQHDALIPALKKVLAAGGDSRLEIKSRYASIGENDPADRYGELYAIAGTEVADVGPTLEASYAPYFIKRSTVTRLNLFANAYVFALTSQINSFNSNLTTNYKKIKARKKSINGQVDSYNSAVSAFNARAQTLGGFASEGQFDAARAVLEGRRNSINGQIKSVNKTIDAYNAQLKQLRVLEKSAISLGRSLNTNLAPVPSVGNVA
jgi:hypothetical protein